MANSDTELLRNIHSARGELYSFFCRMFGNVPDGEAYQMLSEMSEKLGGYIGETDNEDMKSAMAELKDFLERKKSLFGEDLSEFELEVLRNYTTMFCLTKSISTDESFYTSPEHRERGKSYDDMKVLFNRYGIKKVNNIPENEDFVSYEFLFMSKLAYRCAEYIGAGENGRYAECLREQRDFHVNHFDKWIFDFFKRIYGFGIQGETLYKNLARLAQGFISEDKAALEALVPQ